MIRKTVFIISLVFIFGAGSSWAISSSVQEKAALELAKEWDNKRIKPVLSLDGKITYFYGATAVLVKTKLYHQTDIELEPGETLKHITSGDTTRWQIEPAYHGSGDSKTLHIFVKPVDVGLKTDLTILTNKRAYRFNLKSSSKEHMPIVGFEYPKHYHRIVENLRKHDEMEQEQKKKRSLPGIEDRSKRLSIADLDFEYEVNGDEAVWKPVRVYNDGIKTIIELPEKAKYTKVPVLSILDESGENAIVNYRLLDNKFVVDMLFSKAMLKSGVGGDQTKVTIEHKEQ